LLDKPAGIYPAYCGARRRRPWWHMHRGSLVSRAALHRPNTLSGTFRVGL